MQLVSPGAWLTDMCQERYEVREKKSNKKVRVWLVEWFCFAFFVARSTIYIHHITNLHGFYAINNLLLTRFHFWMQQRPRGLKAMGSIESDSE